MTAPHFGALHAMFETQYTDLALAVDAIAGRIRAIGHRAPGSYAEFSVRTEVVEATTEPTKAMEMVAALATDQQMVARAAARVISVANAGGDEPTAGLARHVKRCTRRPLGSCGPSWSDHQWEAWATGP